MGRKTLAVVLASIFVFIIVEGLSSTTIQVYELFRVAKPSALSRYDKSLGWITRPSMFIPNVYGPGKYVRTNARGFRNDDETAVQIPKGKLRVICSGDSFTYGEGVANNRTWCHLLSELNDRFEVVNLGEPGYGVDQMYLRYLRDGISLEQSIHIFAFISHDLTRMSRSDVHRHGKPVLILNKGVLIGENIPVPYFRWWTSRMANSVNFQSVDLVRRVLRRLLPPNGAKAAKADLAESLGPVAAKVFQTIQQLSADKNIVPVFVLLPTKFDIAKDSEWSQWVATTMNTLATSFIDLTPALRGLPAQRVATFFIPDEMPGAGHYTEAGHQWVAEELSNYLAGVARIQTLLAETNTPQIDDD